MCDYFLPKSADRSHISDGYHTFGELYRYRTVLHAIACQHWLDRGYSVIRSKRHSDGEPCFGGGWFIVQATLPEGLVSNHYEMKYWALFQVPTIEKAFKWDGHTPEQACDRMLENIMRESEYKQHLDELIEKDLKGSNR